MELTIEQALQQGMQAHKQGDLQEAECLYRTILQSQPMHPDANHNLGVLVVSVNKADLALPLFKTAVEANPKMERFFRSLKSEWVPTTGYSSFNEAQASITQYIVGYYSEHRPHQHNGGLPPNKAEAKHSVVSYTVAGFT